MYNIKFCVLCKTEAEYKSVNNMDTEYYCKCPNCGGYFVTEQFIKFHEYNIPLHLLSGYVREKNEIGVKDIHITCDNYNDILNSSLIPRLLNDKVDKLVQYMYRKTGYFGENVSINNSIEFAICYALNQVELESIISLLQELKYIKLDTIGGDKDGYVLTYEGIKYAVELDKKVKTSNIAFVAMWFNEKMNNIYKNAIEPAIEIDKKYKAFKMDNHEHNNDITDEIIAGIKNCKFLVADLTGYRAGVYYEAGFARGLGKPVILTCRNDWFDGSADENKKVHFDVNHLNIIVWENEGELKEKLINRIRATID